MPLTNQTTAILLLTVSLGKPDDSADKPLSVNEWAKFAAWLRDSNLQPEDLLQSDLKGLLSGWADPTIALPRVESLLGRGGALAVRLEKWERAGLRVLTRADAEYPPLLKERLKAKSPPVLFVSGNASRLNNDGIAVVGSRNPTGEDCLFASNFAAQASAQGYSIVSGGARGVDQSAMLGALEREGTVVGVLSGGLLADASSAKYRKYIMSGDLTLISPFNPEAGFNVGNAMGRNRYIYCLAVAAVVINCNLNKGGTWNGAVENLKAQWVPLWVKKNDQPDSGNIELTKRGGHWLPEESSDLKTLFDGYQPESAPTLLVSQPQSPQSSENFTGQADPHPAISPAESDGPGEIPEGLDFYQLFLLRLGQMPMDKALGKKEIANWLTLRPNQVDDWLKRGVEEGHIEKLSKPTRYQLRKEQDMFTES